MLIWQCWHYDRTVLTLCPDGVDIVTGQCWHCAMMVLTSLQDGFDIVTGQCWRCVMVLTLCYDSVDIMRGQCWHCVIKVLTLSHGSVHNVTVTLQFRRCDKTVLTLWQDSVNGVTCQGWHFDSCVNIVTWRVDTMTAWRGHFGMPVLMLWHDIVIWRCRIVT